MPQDGDIVSFRTRGWNCVLGDSIHRHESGVPGDPMVTIKAKLGSYDSYYGRYENSECLAHPNHKAHVSDGYAITVILQGSPRHPNPE